MSSLKFQILFVICLFSSAILAQQSSNKLPNTWSGSFGVRIENAKFTGGLGPAISIGKVILSRNDDRLRFHPSLTYARFLNDPFANYGYQSNMLGLKADWDYDMIRINSFSIVTSIGGFVGNIFTSNTNNFYTGVSFPAGFRIAPRERKIAYVLRLLQLQTGTSDYFSGGSQIGIEMNLNKSM